MPMHWILGVTLMLFQFILLMFIIHHDDGRQLSHAGPEPAARVRRSDGRAQPDARRAQPVDDPAGRQQLRCGGCATCWATNWCSARVPGVEPTPRALALWPTVRDALRQLQHTLAPGEFDAGIADTTFLLAMADATAAELMPGLVRIVEDEAPGDFAARAAADHARPAAACWRTKRSTWRSAIFRPWSPAWPRAGNRAARRAVRDPAALRRRNTSA